MKERADMKRHASGLLAAVLLLATAVVARKVDVAWVKPERPANNALTDQRILAAIEKQITGAGLQLVAKNPDLLVTYNIGPGTEHSGSPWRLGSGMGQVQETSQDMGALEVDLIGATDKKIIWRGMASHTISDRDAMNPEKTQKAVARLFKKYPPTVKKELEVRMSASPPGGMKQRAAGPPFGHLRRVSQSDRATEPSASAAQYL